MKKFELFLLLLLAVGVIGFIVQVSLAAIVLMEAAALVK